MTHPAKMYWLYALSPLHPGSGKNAGFIEDPIMREKITQWPMVPGTAVKGIWKDYHRPPGETGNPNDEKLFQLAFGQDPKPGEESLDYASALVITDARIVLLPVRSFFGTFAYATSPLVLRRLKRDLEATATKQDADVWNKLKIPPPPELPDANALVVPENSKIKDAQGKIFLEELEFGAISDRIATDWADFLAAQIFSDENWRALFKERFVVLPDSAFDFLCETGTEVNARIRMEDDTKKVAQGALWYEEDLPAESVLAGLVWCERVYGDGTINASKILETFCKKDIRCQVGGNATTGKGQVECRFSG